MTHGRRLLTNARDILERGRPLFLSSVLLAAEAATADELAAIATQHDIIVGIAGNGKPATRAVAYQALHLMMARASGSQFHKSSMAQLLVEAEPLIAAVLAMEPDILKTSDVDANLSRMIRALQARDPAQAVQAAEDHLILVGHWLDRLPPPMS